MLAHSYTNFKWAKWGLWISKTGSLFRNSQQPTSCSKGVKNFQDILLKVSKHHIPSGYWKDFRSGLPRAAVSLAKERDWCRSVDPYAPELPRIHQEISDIVKTESKKAWRESVESSKPQASPDKYWQLIKILTGKHPNQPPNQPIKFEMSAFQNPKQLPTAFVGSSPQCRSTRPIPN
jgi:hypothetical protein